MTSQRLVRMTFYITYVMLMTTGTICFIEALRNPSPKIRHILNLEVCISVIAAYFYAQFLKKLDADPDSIDYRDINLTRYTDWFISTPLMLLVLCLVLAFNNKQTLGFFLFALILLLNFGMLTFGYVGETQRMARNPALFFGFLCFFLLYTIIYVVFVRPNPTRDNLLIYLLFFGLWTVYGLVYNLSEETKNTTFNLLDMIAKAFVGIFFWMYLCKVITL